MGGSVGANLEQIASLPSSARNDDGEQSRHCDSVTLRVQE